MTNQSIDFKDALEYHEWIRGEGKDVDIVSVVVAPYTEGKSLNVILVTYRE